ncbi:MAG TPA: diaminopimelate decarboxylase [Burkholderiales bacterium]|nr:diaminopimelate decarboxylase [Burkholderiales bacterium]
MTTKALPFSKQQIEAITAAYPTPFHLYDEKGVRAGARALRQAFEWAPGFKEYFAVKATPNPYILTLLRAEGFGADASSYAELLLAEKTGIVDEEIMFTSNNTEAYEFRKARELGAIINLDDITHLSFLEQHAGLPETICFRYNPGASRSGNVIIGKPEEAKFGLTRAQLFEAYAVAKAKGVKRFGLHTMLASNELEAQYFVDTAKMLFELVLEIGRTLDIRFEFVNIGGGIGIPYRPGQEPVDLGRIAAGTKQAYEEVIVTNGLHPLKLYMECGRLITGPHGYLISKVLHIKRTHKTFVGLDACMVNLMRPGMYGAYHHITALGKEQVAPSSVCDVTGSLCENNDKFAIDRMLPEIEIGDIVAIHDAGAHGHSMGFNYNGKLRSAELLLRENGRVAQIRRAETVDDYFATLDFGGLDKFPV